MRIDFAALFLQDVLSIFREIMWQNLIVEVVWKFWDWGRIFKWMWYGNGNLSAHFEYAILHKSNKIPRGNLRMSWCHQKND